MDIDHTANDMDLFAEAGNLESNFYQEGYDGGFAHGRLHGLFEGRALGQEKAWEIWEEVGFYEGFAEYWLEALGPAAMSGPGVSSSAKSKEGRAISQARQLLDLISTFPTTNPTPTPDPAVPSDTNMDSNTRESNIAVEAAEDPTDLPRLLSSIRAKYRLLCTSVGARPRLVAAAAAITSNDEGAGDATSGVEGFAAPGQTNMTLGAPAVIEGVVAGIEGPMKGVDTRQLRF